LHEAGNVIPVLPLSSTTKQSAQRIVLMDHVCLIITSEDAFTHLLYTVRMVNKTPENTKIATNNTDLVSDGCVA
jgi:hypothetical protein